MRLATRFVNVSGFQLLELMLAIAAVGVLAMIAVTSYSQYRDKADRAIAAADIHSIAMAVDRFFLQTNNYPDSLDQVGYSNAKDPWGNPYQYLRINGSGITGKANLRKDKNLVPINSDFDLYSMGKDCDSKPPLTAKASHDDVIRANNGKYIGTALDY